MRHIIGILRPFDLEQTFYVCEGDNQIECIHSTIEDLSNDIFMLVDKYKINEIKLTGSKQYTLKIKQNLEQEALLKYNQNILNIECL